MDSSLCDVWNEIAFFCVLIATYMYILESLESLFAILLI